MSIIDKIASEQNLLWAWEKVHGYYRTMENYYDMLVVSEFEAHLNDILADMVEKLKKGRYRLETIKPIPRPKKSKDESPAIRSFFNVSICDQILWIAIINIIGPDIECEMPFWSFGNRLNIPLYRDEDTWRHGWYRYGSYNMYTPWFQAWSRYQKSTKITLKRMFYQQKEEGAFLSEELESSEVELLNESKANLGHLQINYLDRDYWSQPLGGEVYWASLDFEKFYPSINLDKLRDILLNRYPGDVDFHNLIKKALDFQVDRSDFSDEEWVELQANGISYGKCDGLPTGLLAAGFLANVYLLEIDKLVMTRLITERKIAHFRFVDDHIILANSFDTLEQWINEYTVIIQQYGGGVTINNAKTTPQLLSAYLTEGLDRKEAVSACKLDKDFCKPFMTQTLDKMYMISNIEQDFSTLEESEKNLADLLQMLSVDLPEEDVRAGTKTSFLTTQIARHASIYLNNMSRRNIAERIAVALSEIENTNKEIQMLDLCIEELRKQCLKSFSVEEQVNKESVCAEMEKAAKQRYDLVEKVKVCRNNLHILRDEIPELRYHPNTLQKQLLKAIDENSDKVNLWRSFFSFVRKNGINQTAPLINQINKMQGNVSRFNKLTITYIHTYIFSCLVHELHIALKIILSRETSVFDKQRNFLFLLFATDCDVISLLSIKAGYRFHTDMLISYLQIVSVTSRLLGHAKDCFPIAFNDFCITINLLDQYQKNLMLLREYLPMHICQSAAVDTRAVWSCISSHMDFFESHPGVAQPEYEHILKGVLQSSDNPDYCAIALLTVYPAWLPVTALQRSSQILGFMEKRCGQGWIIDSLVSCRREEFAGFEVSSKVQKYFFKNHSEGKWRSLDSFIKRLYVELRFENRSLMEYISVNIVLKIIEYMKKMPLKQQLDMDETQKKFHALNAYNILINSDELCDILCSSEKVGFAGLLVNLCEKIEIRFSYKRNVIMDPRYHPVAKSHQDIDGEYPVAKYALIVLLMRLLTLNDHLPGYFNIPIFDKSAGHSIQRLIADVPISSTSHVIISEAVGRMSAERRFARNLQRHIWKEKRVKNLIEIGDLHDLEDALKNAAYILKCNQIIDARSITQAVPIDLNQISSYESVYVDMEEV